MPTGSYELQFQDSSCSTPGAHHLLFSLMNATILVLLPVWMLWLASNQESALGTWPHHPPLSCRQLRASLLQRQAALIANQAKRPVTISTVTTPDIISLTLAKTHGTQRIFTERNWNQLNFQASTRGKFDNTNSMENDCVRVVSHRHPHCSLLLKTIKPFYRSVTYLSHSQSKWGILLFWSDYSQHLTWATTGVVIIRVCIKLDVMFEQLYKLPIKNNSTSQK